MIASLTIRFFYSHYIYISSIKMMLLGVAWYAYTVGSMSTILASFDKQSKQKREKMIQVNTFVRETRLPPALGKRVRRYFEYSISRKKHGLFGYDADVILQELSNTLRTDVLCFVESDLIKSIPFFEGKSPTFIANAIQLLRPVVVQAGEYIIKEGSASDEMYFLIEGTAAVYYGYSEVKKLYEGAYFGEIGCILGGVRKASIMAATLCELRCLSRQDLNQLLGQHPSVGEDLKKVARARMKVVKSNNNPNNKAFGDKNVIASTKSLRAEEDNLAKLEQVDFHGLKNATDEFRDLRKHLEGMTRKLSLTSGVLANGNHIKVEKEVLDKMNTEENDQHIENESSNETIEGSNDNVSMNQGCKQQQKQTTGVVQQTIQSKGNNYNVDESKVQTILATLKQEEREIIQTFVLNSISFQTNRKVQEFMSIAETAT